MVKVVQCLNIRIGKVLHHFPAKGVSIERRHICFSKGLTQWISGQKGKRRVCILYDLLICPSKVGTNESGHRHAGLALQQLLVGGFRNGLSQMGFQLAFYIKILPALCAVGEKLR